MNQKEQPAEEPEKTEAAPEETTTEEPKEDSPKPAEETPVDDMEKKKLERFFRCKIWKKN